MGATEEKAEEGVLTGRLVKVQGGGKWDNGKRRTNKVIKLLELAASHTLGRGGPQHNRKVEVTMSDTVTWKLCAFVETEMFKVQELNHGTGWGLKISKP